MYSPNAVIERKHRNSYVVLALLNVTKIEKNVVFCVSEITL
jgi:hypothetical protein